ncbi:hypothetical protein GCM10011529_06790 [Polymorphobacter glacialis]|uniref:Uncharacterized protein n=1 Tax=Sandarakinorhabdus glacialis TaxID=1614636 RepID=A0A917E4K7_9SPHN|nr:hypothetical protein [Polymorphobacter glacialis]GGE02991.1 hypothetical protein GCM10011529_06790 [Polymorphobacter glacialis]
MHLAAGSLWLAARIEPPLAPPEAIALLAFRAPASPAPAPEPVPAKAYVPVPTAVAPQPEIAEVVIDPPATASARDAACAPLKAVQAALASDPAVRTAIAAVPTGARSVAEAIVVWNQGWSPLASLEVPLAGGEAPLAGVRALVARTLAALPAHCLAEPITGPRLVLVEGAAQTAVLAFGSGAWRWRDLDTQVVTQAPQQVPAQAPHPAG